MFPLPGSARMQIQCHRCTFNHPSYCPTLAGGDVPGGRQNASCLDSGCTEEGAGAEGTGLSFWSLQDHSKCLDVLSQKLHTNRKGPSQNPTKLPLATGRCVCVWPGAALVLNTTKHRFWVVRRFSDGCAALEPQGGSLSSSLKTLVDKAAGLAREAGYKPTTPHGSRWGPGPPLSISPSWGPSWHRRLGLNGTQRWTPFLPAAFPRPQK